MRVPLTIIVPAKHEEHTVIPTLQSLQTHVKTPHNILVVNVSDKHDRTKNIVRTYTKTHTGISIIYKIHPHGTFGMALQLGLTQATGTVVVPFMADGCDDPKDIDRMYQLLGSGWDVVCASRYISGGRKIGGPRLQSFFSRVVCWTLQRITGIPTSDISNAFKMYKKEALTHISLNSASGVEESMDILLQVFENGARITEIPTTWRGRTAGRSKFRMFERIPKYLTIYVRAISQTIRKKNQLVRLKSA